VLGALRSCSEDYPTAASELQLLFLKSYGKGMPKALEAAMLQDAHVALANLERWATLAPDQT
jgi:hypothetical protein